MEHSEALKRRRVRSHIKKLLNDEDMPLINKEIKALGNSQIYSKRKLNMKSYIRKLDVIEYIKQFM